MGHRHVSGPPRTPAFKRLIGLLGDSAGGSGAAGIGAGSLEEIAAATIDASTQGLERAKSDEGVGYCLYLLAQLTRAATSPQFDQGLDSLGMPTPFAPSDPTGFSSTTNSRQHYSVFELVAGFTGAVDQHLREKRGRTDISEMALLSASESLSALCGPRANTLFGATHETVQASLSALATEKGFARLTHDFFARLSRRFIEYHLSRELSNHVGATRRFKGAGEHNEFLRQLDDHCRVATGVVRQFAGEWYGKHRFQNDITPRAMKAFAAHAVDKVRDALKYLETRDAV